LKIIGISAFYHDSAAALVVDGEVIAAAQEERFTRIKHDASFPLEAIKFCLDYASLNLSDIDFFVFYDKPFLKFERILESYFTYAPKGFKTFSISFPSWIKEKLFQKSNIIKLLSSIANSNKKIDWSKRLLFSEHHLSHASSAFFPSPFKEAAILTLDGVGEWTTTSIAYGSNNTIKILKEIHYPHSIGLLYSAFTSYCGFKVNSGEYKLMGLAPYGTPRFAKLIKKYLVKINNDGSFFINMDYFNYGHGLTMTNDKFHELFKDSPRNPESEISQKIMDIAASIQAVLEEIIYKIAFFISKTTKSENLCLAGGVALNCVANGFLIKKKLFKNIWVQPASGDAGGSLGSALAVYYIMLNNKRIVDIHDSMKGTFLGPSFSDKEIKRELTEVGAKYKSYSYSKMIEKTATYLSKGYVIGWFQGRMEFGPRSLGSRSILADPRPKEMQKKINLKIKFRESFRPFAPSILRSDLEKWFDLKVDSPYMLFVAPLKKAKRLSTFSDKKLFGIKKLNVARSKIPACTHVDFSARIQTVRSQFNRPYFDLISKFKHITGCPLIVNTSFNIRGEPIVLRPRDAYKCFMSNDMDILVLGNLILEKKIQPNKLVNNYKDSYALD
jgi:carbamoyltransferase